MQDNFPASSIIKALCAADLEVHVVVPYSPTSPDKSVTYHIADIYKSLAPLFSSTKPDLVISAVAGGSFETQKNIIEDAVEAGVPRFMPAEFGQDSLNSKIQDRLPPSKERARTIEYLRQLSDDGRISWAAVATGIALDRGILNENLGFDIKWQSATLHGQGRERFAASSALWVGRAALAVIERWGDVENQYLYVAGMVTSADEVIDSLQRATGHNFEVGRADVEDCVREAERRIERGFPDAGMFLMERSVLYDESLAAVKPFMEQDANGRLGLDGEHLDDLIAHVTHDHEHHSGKVNCGCD